MKKLLSICVLFAILSCVLIGCCKDDNDTATVEDTKDNNDTVNDTEAGTFEIASMDGVELQQDEKFLLGDTIKIFFQPKEEYQSFKFELNCELLTRINDTLFVIPIDLLRKLGIENNSSANGYKNTKISVSAKYKDDLYTLSAENSFDIIVVEKPQNEYITNAGTFELYNLSTLDGQNLITKGINISIGLGPTYDLYGGDTIKIRFTPKREYRQHTFDIVCKGLDKINDSIYVVPRIIQEDNHLLVTMSASCQIRKSTTIYNISASNSKTLSYMPDFVFDVRFELEMSDDLLKFARPKLTYTDASGNEITLILNETDFTKETIHAALYKDSEGWSHVIYDDKQPDPEWTLVEERDVFMTYYPFASKFTKRDTELKVHVKYLPIENISLTQDRYQFEHDLRWYADGYVNVYIPISITIDGSETDKVNRAQAYLNSLFASSDSLKLKIDNTGTIKSVLK